MTRDIRVGIEIECLYNKKYHIDRGSYHAGIPAPISKWLVENDSSLHPSRGIFIRFTANPIEFISPVTINKEDFFKEIKKFIKYFSQDGKRKLKDIFYFNKTCGAHVHISLNRRPGIFLKRTINDVFINTRKRFHREIKNSKLPVKIQKQILQNYNRCYSSQVWDRHRRQEVKYHRDYEFNFYSETCGKGLEWRAPNMCGIETWEQFTEFWKLTYRCIEYLVETSRKWSEFQEHKIDIKQYDKYFAPIKEDVKVSASGSYASTNRWHEMARRSIEEGHALPTLELRDNNVAPNEPHFLGERTADEEEIVEDD